jgi:hypothetical protein
VRDHEIKLQQEATLRAQEAAILKGEIAACKADEAASREALRQQNLKIKADRLSQVSGCSSSHFWWLIYVEDMLESDEKVR